MANCNLHNQAVGEGISAVVHDVNIRQYIEQQQQQVQLHGEPTRLQPSGQGQAPGQAPLLRRSVWLEAGSVNLNLITADIALAADHPAKCEVQRHFLELHDAQTKRYRTCSTLAHRTGFCSFAPAHMPFAASALCGVPPPLAALVNELTGPV